MSYSSASCILNFLPSDDPEDQTASSNKPLNHHEEEDHDDDHDVPVVHLSDLQETDPHPHHHLHESQHHHLSHPHLQNSHHHHMSHHVDEDSVDVTVAVESGRTGGEHQVDADDEKGSF